MKSLEKRIKSLSGATLYRKTGPLPASFMVQRYREMIAEHVLDKHNRGEPLDFDDVCRGYHEATLRHLVICLKIFKEKALAEDDL